MKKAGIPLLKGLLNGRNGKRELKKHLTNQHNNLAFSAYRHPSQLESLELQVSPEAADVTNNGYRTRRDGA